MPCGDCGSATMPGRDDLLTLARNVADFRAGEFGDAYRVDGETYSRRIAACAACEALAIEVLCAHCGCFISVRAHDSRKKCPHPAGSRWE